MSAPIIKIKRGSTAPSVLSAGELAADLTNKNLYIGQADGTPLAIAGEGTFAKKADLGTMSTQNADSVAITGGSIDGTTIGATTPSTGKFTTVEATDQLNVAGSASFVGATTTILNSGDLEFSMTGGGMVLGLRAPSDARDATNKEYVDGLIANLGSVLRYIGDVSGTDLDALSDTTTGAYYKVNVAGTYTSGADSFAAKVGDAFVKTSTGWQKLDNVDAVVSGTTNEISVSGDENAGYTVAIDSAFSSRVSTAETEIDDLQTKTQNIVLAGTTAGTTKIDGGVVIDTVVGATIPSLLVGTIYGTGEADRLFYADGNTYTVEMGVSYGGEVKVRSPKFVGVDNSSGDMPAIENFIIDGGEY